MTPESLLFDVQNDFTKDGRYFPIEAKDLIYERFQYRREYAEMQRIQDEQKQIADFIGGGQVMQSITDEIVDDLRNPRAEIMDIDMSEYATTRETVMPTDIEKFVEKGTWFGRFTKRFASIFRRK